MLCFFALHNTLQEQVSLHTHVAPPWSLCCFIVSLNLHLRVCCLIPRGCIYTCTSMCIKILVKWFAYNWVGAIMLEKILYKILLHKNKANSGPWLRVFLEWSWALRLTFCWREVFIHAKSIFYLCTGCNFIHYNIKSCCYPHREGIHSISNHHCFHAWNFHTRNLYTFK